MKSIELSELEELFYEIYKSKFSECNSKLILKYQNKIKDPLTLLMFQGILEIKGFIPEDAFFKNNESIFINQHPRYMPAEEHSHDFFEIQYVLKGNVKQQIGGFNVALQEGDICFISPSASHNPEVNDHETIMINILLRAKTFRKAFSNCLLEDDIISSFFMRVLHGQAYHPFLLCSTNSDEKIASLILEMLYNKNNPDLYTDRLLHTKVEQLFIYLLRDYEEDFSTGSFQKNNEENIFSILRYVQNNFSTISLRSLSEYFNYNESYLSRMLKSNLGCTFSEYLTDLKLKKAAELLSTTKVPVTEILLQAGYTDKTHFYRAFNKKFGVTPNQYRMENR